MPRLARVRFLSIGHPNARFDDLTIDLRDANGRATDSTIWLRNGGGKSSILNLFFAVIRTSRRDFLGGRAESRRRTLDDYVLSGEQSCVATEWELDDPSGALALGEPQRFLAGVFYENRQGEALRRLFFATRCSPRHPASNLDGLPFLTATDKGAQARHTLTAFRQQWLALRDEAPTLQAACTETQSEWHQLLDGVGIDPDLFRYQLQMNLREGGADELFRFETDEEFIDFLLQLTVEPDRADLISGNIREFREQLRRRAHEFVPERELCEGLVSRLEPIESLVRRRGEHDAQMDFLARRLGGLSRAAVSRLDELRREADALDGRREGMRNDATARRASAEAARREAAAWSLLAARQATDAARVERDFRREAQRDTDRRERLCDAARYLQQAHLHELEAAQHRDEHQRRQRDFAPDLERLHASARRYVAALRHRHQSLAMEREEVSATVAETEADVRRHRAAAADASRAAAVARSRVADIERRIEALDRRRTELARAGVIRDGESPRDARARLDQEATRHRQTIERAAAWFETQAAREDAIREERERLRGARAEKDAERRGAERELATARFETDVLDQDALLRRILETETIDWDSLPDSHILLLARAAASLRQQAAARRAERADDERARVYLESEGLLPPEPAVEAVLRALPAGVRALSGWAWIAANVPDTKRARRDVATRHPDLARGVIVRPEDFERAVESLRLARVSPREPVLLATPDAFDTPRAGLRHVVGPGTDAFFDHEAGKQLLESLNARVEKLDRDAERAESEAERLLELGARIRQFRSRFPIGWFAQTGARAQALAAETAAIAERVAALDVELEEIQGARRSRERERSDAIDALRRVDTVRARLDAFAEEYDAEVPRLHSERDALATESADRLRDEAAKLAEAEALAEAVERHRLRASALAMSVRELEATIASIPWLEDRNVPPEAGPIDELRVAFENDRRYYESRVSADGLLEMAEQLERLARDARAQMTRVLGATLSEADVVALLASTPDRDDLARQTEEARQRRSQAAAHLAEAELALQQASERLAQATRVHNELKRPPIPDESLDATAARDRARAAEERANRELADAARMEESVRDASVHAQLARQRAETLQRDLKRIDSLLRTLGVEPDVQHVDPDVVLTDIDLGDELERLEGMLRGVTDALRTLDTERRRAVDAVRRWCTDARFEGLASEVLARFRTLDEPSLIDESGRYLEHLRLRTRELERQIADLDQHRMQLTRLIVDLAETGLRQLELAARASRVPGQVPEIGGQHFLDISMKPPADPFARRELIGRLIDEIIDEKDVPTGIELIQRGVRAIARPFRVRVLNPNTAAERKRIPVNETAKFSGGEQLTCAILLYCTLANVRARNRGMARQPTGVLVLDNPIGRASRPKFLEMQREFARAMGIQLVYTTAVNDHEALRVLPNVIRLRNERIDRRLGRHYVELDADATPDAGPEVYGHLEAIRVVRRETSDLDNAGPAEGI